MEALSAIGSVLAVIDLIGKSYNAIDQIRKLPEAFDAVKQQLPLVENILRTLQRKVENNNTTIDEETNRRIKDVLQACKTKADDLRGIMKQIEDKGVELEKNNTPKIWARFKGFYQDALKGVKGNRVESLMAYILEQVKVLALNEIFSLHEVVESLDKGLAQLANVDPSVPDSEFDKGSRYAHQEVHSGGRGMMNNVLGDKSTNTFQEIHGDGHSFNYGKGS